MPTALRSWSERLVAVRDDCGYARQAERITDYQMQHTPEGVLPYVADRDDEHGHPEGCSTCGKATWWESRKLPDGRIQTPCTECRCTLIFD